MVNNIENGSAVLIRLFRLIQTPPPWLWAAGGRIWQRPGRPRGPRLALELLQQLHHWLWFPSRWRRLRTASLREIPWPLIIQACWLNSYRPAELLRWWSTGERSWSALSRHTPDSQSAAIHAQQRHCWPDQCLPALRLLSDKAALLASTPAGWKAPALLLDHHSVGDQLPVQATPRWWSDAMRGDGLVLKPQRGHAGRHQIGSQWAALWCFQLSLLITDRVSQLCDSVQQHGFAHATQPQQHPAFVRTPQPHTSQGQFRGARVQLMALSESPIDFERSVSILAIYRHLLQPCFSICPMSVK